ncbi:MAG: 2Fe-2S iron-sulfur cluster binding domain-containing protein [Mogibacterium sp.]|nr:2Fe-2S iron-sulfur cluster binding domain-containing protein [Mogibacterium sp.]
MKYTIKDAQSGTTFIGRDDESIFRAMHKSGRSIFKGGCEGGGCGICKVKILEGEYLVFKNMSRAHVSEEGESQGIVLACCVKPSGDIVLEKV